MPNFCRRRCSESLLGEVHLNLNCQSPQLNGWLTWNVLRMCGVDFLVWRYWDRTYPTTSPGRKRTSVFTICMCSNCSMHIKGLNWSDITLCIKRLLDAFILRPRMKDETEPLAFGIGVKFWSSPCNKGIIMKKTLGAAGGWVAEHIGSGFCRETSLHYHLTTPLRFAATGRRRNRQNAVGWMWHIRCVHMQIHARL